jgi:hypothetical protein
MSKLQSYKRIISTDYEPEDRELVDQLAISLNSAIDDALYTLNGKVNLVDNIHCSVRDVILTPDASGGTSNTRFSIQNVPSPVQGCQVIKVTNLSNNLIYPTGTPFITFTQLDNSILINNITNLATGYRWQVRVIVWH